MTRLISAFVFACAMLLPTVVDAGSIIWLDTCIDGTRSCDGSVRGLSFFVDDGGAVRGHVQGTYRGDNAFGFNIAGPTDGLAISLYEINIFDPRFESNDYSFGGNDQTIGPLGSFEFVLDGPPPVSSGATSPNSFFFRLTRDAGFLSELEVFEMNHLGFLVGGRRVDFFGDTVFEAGSAVAPITPVPEPASMLLLGTGLVAAWRARRRSI